MAARPKILVVDDERVIADTLAIILNQYGYEAYTGYDGIQAVERARSLSPDLMICDVIMPHMNGIEAAIHIRAFLPTCKILLFSGQAATADLLESARARGHEFEILAKPVHPQDLLAKLRGQAPPAKSAIRLPHASPAKPKPQPTPSVTGETLGIPHKEWLLGIPLIAAIILACIYADHQANNPSRVRQQLGLSAEPAVLSNRCKQLNEEALRIMDLDNQENDAALDRQYRELRNLDRNGVPESAIQNRVGKQNIEDAARDARQRNRWEAHMQRVREAGCTTGK
jgi:CheY-like chemotaxis protein